MKGFQFQEPSPVPLPATTQSDADPAELKSADVDLADVPPVVAESPPPAGPVAKEARMILPFMAFTWSVFGGQYAQPFVFVEANSPFSVRAGAQSLIKRPKGRRVVLFQNAEIEGRLFTHPGDLLQGKHRSLWWTEGLAATKVKFGNVVEQLYAAKADVDFVVFDIESAFNFWALDAASLAAMYADPRYAALVATGRFPADCRSMGLNEIYLFNYGCTYLINAAIKEAIIGPLYKRYNNVNWCQYYDNTITKADAAVAPDFNAHPQYLPASTAPYAAPSLYAYSGNLGKNDPRFMQPWYVLAWSLNTIRANYRGNPASKVMPWLGPRTMSNVWDQAHWQEHIFHCCCLCGLSLLYFNADDFSAISNWRFDNALSQFVGQCRGKVWKSTVITAMTDYDKATYVISACKLADGSLVGRITFKPGVNSATFTLLGKKYTVKRAAGAIGAWFHS